MTPDQYAQAVRDALAGHPDREELLEDLDDHLTEIAADSDVPLELRLGPPEIYAEELAAAYGGRPRSGPRRRVDPRAWALRAHAGLMGQGPYRSFAGFLPELRPGWWVLRGYLLTMLLLSATSGERLVPSGLADLAAVAVGIWASVWFGRRRWGRLLTLVAVAANVAAALVLLSGLGSAGFDDPPPAVYMAERQPVWVDNASTEGVYNIKPYAKDGTPLTDVYLYDQDGKPLTTNPEQYGYQVDRSCGAPILNRYPLPLVEEWTKEPGVPSPAPSACPTPTGPTPSATPSPASTR
ncbi:hypothetical protein SAMN05444920_112208 [Nonomuraea solani]|uniref:Proline-rich protein n=1 Tax=Nonomuraea solani TaxID=1144553 RepID=A0A1H6EMH3_9ACTN|nr:hypothetical protein [Nonomuraea solani]SEG99080.1 hypothetical protein SAMN05444920_112208 [Nonomuraea solani]